MHEDVMVDDTEDIDYIVQSVFEVAQQAFDGIPQCSWDGQGMNFYSLFENEISGHVRHRYYKAPMT